MSILVYAEHDNASLKPVTLNVVAAAKAIAEKAGGEIHVLVAGSDCAAAAEAAAKIEGVAKVLKADAPEYDAKLAENIAPLLVKLAESYDYILGPTTTGARNVLPRAAALLDVQGISDISEVVEADTFVRPIYAGNALAKVKSSDAKKLITVRGTAFDAVAAEGGSAAIEEVASAGDAGLSSFVGHELTKSERPELTSARVIISGGRGMQSGENFAMLERIADKLGAAVGASRAAVDAGYVPNDYQVGQTGKVVAPELYIAVGISGAIQHLAGMKDSKVIVAINKDEEAPIFQVADYGLVADLFKAVPELEAELDKA
ncbi:MAG: FAD-binding protein [Tistlia sp.]|uniref:electron transfer flavoprotein subunit alpha/FixB family protein n=1 Tax=Tistlia sp. TaxID=3057121 RepID=UPI0034A379C0